MFTINIKTKTELRQYFTCETNNGLFYGYICLQYGVIIWQSEPQENDILEIENYINQSLYLEVV